jgi:two-component system chemotaxis sensor kinase CheA
MLDELDQVLRDFIVESQENLGRLDQEFVGLENNPDNKELLASIFRTIHTIKGSAGFLRLANLEHISHYTEDVLAKLRNHSLTLDADLTTTLLSAVDGIKSILVHLQKTGEEGEQNIREVIEDLNTVITGKKKGKRAAPRRKTSTTSRNKASAAPKTVHAEAPVVPERPGAEPPVPAQKPAVVGAERAEEPPDTVETRAKEQRIADTMDHVLSTVEDTRIHVDLGLLDHLMNLTGELVLARNRVVQFSSSETIDPQAFRAIAQRLNVVVSELQETMLKTRMQPVKKVFGILPRLVRDLSTIHGKAIDLRLEGQETELDRTLLEAMKDPLTHLVRNAIDHGIEAPEVRRQQGKPPTGTITLTAAHEGGQVHIEIADDGAGIDLEAVKANALTEGLITSQRAEELSERELLHLIFRPGFSTATTVTNISGRGVGMDVVRKNLNRIGGIIEIHTEAQQGTTVTIRIPITLAIIPVLIISAAAHRFAIPQVNLEELVMLQEEEGADRGIERLYGAEVYRLRGELLPLLRLNQVLQLSGPDETPQTGTNIVVVSAGSVRFGIIVDEVGDTEEIVVKPLSRHVKQLPCYDGATIMGDGKVALILNVNGLFTAAQFDLEEMKGADQADQMAQAAALVEAQGEHRQTIVLFRVGKGEYYGVPLAFVVRLEEFPTPQIEYSGGREVLQYRGDVLPLLRLEPYLNLASTPDPELLSLIVFSVEKPVGLVVQEILNTVEISTHIDTETFAQKGVLGSTIVEGHAVLILDIHGLIELAYPTWYKQFFVSTLSEAEREQIRVLLVEDSAFFLNIEQSYLASAGYQVLTAEHGQAAVAVLEQQPVDVVVTDIDMPYCNGYELTKIIKGRAEWRHLPVMALTALSGEEDRRRGLDAGIDEYKIKLDREDVLRALEQLILRSRKKT